MRKTKAASASAEAADDEAPAPREMRRGRYTLTTSSGKAEYDTVETDFGSDRKVKVRRTTVGDAFDLNEWTPAGASAQWMGMAMIAISVVELDGKPMPGVSSKSEARRLLEMLGSDGFDAAAEAGEAMQPKTSTEAAQRAQVGNSSQTPPSAS